MARLESTGTGLAGRDSGAYRGMARADLAEGSCNRVARA